MKPYTAKDLQYWATIQDANGNVLAERVGAGVRDLQGTRLEQAQLISSETSHMIVMRAEDATAVTSSCSILVGGLVYVVDSRPLDPRNPRPNQWVEIPCHVEANGQC